ncbi:MAG: monovalent cation/H+ antiporter subunit D family protein [Dethiobacter sp.]|jgi:multicomponent Na+:H+ antiporter subunit D|nr:monovalent cation/H+ antiporter subunit D family protein [Dethiobacter sp.]
MHFLPTLAVVIPLVSAFFIIVFSRSNVIVSKIIAVAGAILTFLSALAMYPVVGDGSRLGIGTTHLSPPLSFFFQADALSFFMGVVFSFCFMLIIIYSLGYLEHGHAKARYLALIIFTEGAMLGIVMSASLIGFLIFFELMTVGAYLLVIHEEDEVAMFAGAKFLYMSLAAGLCIFFGMVITYFIGGRLDFVPGGYIMASPLARYALLAFLLGFGVKAGMFPVHIWLPDAHPAAPAPVSAMLSGLSIKTGAYGLIRVIHDVYGVDVVRSLSLDRTLLVLAVITILLGSAMALQEDHLKRRLAYSSVAQIGYILLGISLLTERAMFGVLLHIFSHALMKGTLFLCAGAIITQTGKKYISEMKGIGYEMPVVMMSFTLAAVTIVGIPPFNAFISKWQLALASLETGQAILVAVLMASSLLNALYYFPIISAVFMPSGAEYRKKSFIRDKVPVSMLWTTALMALLCIGFAFVQPHWPVLVASRIAASLF